MTALRKTPVALTPDAARFAIRAERASDVTAREALRGVGWLADMGVSLSRARHRSQRIFCARRPLWRHRGKRRDHSPGAVERPRAQFKTKQTVALERARQ